MDSSLTQRLTFAAEAVKQLTAVDFNLDSRELITLKYEDCILVLFYTENQESHQLAQVWAEAAAQVAGPVFAAVNMLSERRVAEAFIRLKGEGSHPLHWAALRQYPFILVFRKRWPVAAYNGARDVQDLVDYSLTLACQAGYYEAEQLGAGVTDDHPSGIPGLGPTEVRTQSSQYNGPLRQPLTAGAVGGTGTTVPSPSLSYTVPGTTNAVAAMPANSTTSPTSIPSQSAAPRGPPPPVSGPYTGATTSTNPSSPWGDDDIDPSLIATPSQ